jgi:hypothetical protein
MRRTRMVALCLTTMFAASGIAAASASALPEFTSPFPKPFRSTSKKSVLETVGKTKVTCKGDTNTGEIINPTTLTVTITFTGCESKKFTCTSPGAAVGDIVTKLLVGRLGYIHAPKKEVGLDLSADGGTITQFQCGNLVVVVRGSVIGRITPVNKVVSAPGVLTLRFAQKGGKQAITKFEGGPPDVLESSINGGPFEESGLSSTDLIKVLSPVEVKA